MTPTVLGIDVRLWFLIGASLGLGVALVSEWLSLRRPR